MTLTDSAVVGAAGSAVDRVWNALDAGGFKPESIRGDKFMALCPVHGDTHRSLSVKFDRRREAVLFNCFTCHADYREVASAIGLAVTDLFDVPLPEKDSPQRSKGKPKFEPAHRVPRRITGIVDVDELAGSKWEQVTTYPYADDSGTVVEEVIREHAVVDGVVHKRFRQRFRSAAGRWVTKKPTGFVPVLYQHADVLRAIAIEQPVWIVEGEKDADNAAARGLVATTNAQGSGSFPRELADVFTGATVNVVADRDSAGYKRAAQLHRMLGEVGATVTLYRPAVDVDKGDLTDHFEAGLGVEDLEEISVGNAVLLQLIADTVKGIEAIAVCSEEIRAHQELIASGEDASEHDEAIAAWARESLLRYRRLSENVGGVVSATGATDSLSRAVMEQAERLVDEAARTAQEAYDLTGVRTPTSITERLKPADRRVQFSENSVASEAGDPPAFTGNTFIPGDDDAPNRGREFTVRKGQTVEIKYERDGEGYRRRFNTVIDGWGDIISVAFEDNGHESEITRATHEMTVRFSRWVRDAEGNPVYEENGVNKIESEVVTWDEEQLQRGTWADALPWVGMLENTSRRGRELAWDALHNARPAPYARERVYTTTGWRQGESGSYFVHSGGAISATGTVPLRTRMVGGIEHLRVAEPTTDAAVLRAAWEGSTVPLREKLPARAIAPVLALVWRAPFAPVPHVCYLNGAAGSGKSTIARLGMHYFAPGLVQQEGSPKTILSATAAGGSASGIGLMRVVRAADFMPVLADDFVDLDVKKAEAKLENLTRGLFDGAGHVAGRARGGVTASERPQASVLATGQIGVTGSALQRLFTIALNPGDIPHSTETFMQLEQKARREERATLGAALLQWLAIHREDLQAEYFNPDSTSKLSLHALTTAWTERLRNTPHNDGARGRMITAAVVSIHGISLMLRMLVENKAITRDEANDFYAWAEAGIDEGIRLQDPGSGDVALLTMELLREALASQAAHISLTDGEAPENAEQLGWSRRGRQPNDVLVPSGPKIGTIKVHSDGTDRLYLFPMVAFEVIKKVAAGAGMGFSDTTTSIGSSFAGAPHFWITPEFTNRDSSTQHTVRPIQGGPPMKVWDLPLSALFGELDGDDDTDRGTNPSDLSLFDGPMDFGTMLDDAPAEEPVPEPEAAAAAETPAPASTPAPQREARTSPRRAETPSTSTPEKRAATAPGQGFRGVVGVLDERGVWLPDGQCVPLPFPIRHIGDAAKVIANLNLGYRHPGAWKSEDGQLLVTDAAARQLGLPVDQLTGHEGRERTEELYKLTVDHPFLTDAIAEGYEVGGTQVALNPMTRVWMPGNDRLRGRFALMSALQDDFTALRAGDADSATIARRLQRYAEMIGKPYAVSAAVTGIDLMLDLAPSREKRLERFTPHTPVGPAEIPTLEADINWQRKPVGEELEHTYVHAFDRGGSYLAGVSGQHYGIGEPRYLPEGSRIEFKSTTPGYWRVVLPERREWLHPNPIDPFNRDQDIVGMKSWLTTATVTIAQDLGYELEIVEAYVWDTHGRILDSWAERVAQARAALDTEDPDDQAVRELVKPTYTRGLGRIASFEHMKGRPGFAPERYHLIQARSRANIIRRIMQIGNETGRWPVAVKQDTILYTSNETNPEKAWPGRAADFGRGLGQYKPEGFAFLNEHLQFLTGEGRYDGKGHLDLELF